MVVIVKHSKTGYFAGATYGKDETGELAYRITTPWAINGLPEKWVKYPIFDYHSFCLDIECGIDPREALMS